MVSKKDDFATLLARNGLSDTKTRRLVFEAFVAGQPISMAELVAKVQGVDRATIYRGVSIFESLGILNRLTSGWKYKLELSDLFSEHHHHVTCTRCGKVAAFHETSQLNDDIALAGQSVDYTVVSHSLEIKGLCPTCQIT